MKKIAAALLILVLVFSLSGCTRERAPEEIIREFDDPAIYEGQFTAETFVAYISANDVGLSIEDFEQAEVTIDEFLEWDWLTPGKIGAYKLDLKNELDEYIHIRSTNTPEELESKIRRNEFNRQEALIEPYWVYELKYVRSSKGEYQDFIKRYFEALEADATLLEKDNNGWAVYQANIGEYNLKLYFCQTYKSRWFPIEYSASFSRYQIDTIPGFRSYCLDLYAHNSGKYFMYVEDLRVGCDTAESFEVLLKLVKTFAALEA